LELERRARELEPVMVAPSSPPPATPPMVPAPTAPAPVSGPAPVVAKTSPILPAADDSSALRPVPAPAPPPKPPPASARPERGSPRTAGTAPRRPAFAGPRITVVDPVAGSFERMDPTPEAPPDTCHCRIQGTVE